MKKHDRGQSEMKKKIVSCLVVCVVIVLSYFYAHIDKNSYIYDRNADAATFYGTGILAEGEELSQTFVSMEEKVDGVKLKVTTVGNVESIVVKYKILDEELNVVYEGKIPASELENNKFNQLKVSGVEDALKKQYTLVLCEEKADEQNGVAFYIEPGRYDNQKLTVKGNETDGTLVFRSVCHEFDVETFVVLLGMIAFVMAFMKVLYKLFK